jgi:hypothetical protein
VKDLDQIIHGADRTVVAFLDEIPDVQPIPGTHLCAREVIIRPVDGKSRKADIVILVETSAADELAGGGSGQRRGQERGGFQAHTQIHTHTHTYTHTNAHTYSHTHTHTHNKGMGRE